MHNKPAHKNKNIFKRAGFSNVSKIRSEMNPFLSVDDISGSLAQSLVPALKY